MCQVAFNGSQHARPSIIVLGDPDEDFGEQIAGRDAEHRADRGYKEFTAARAELISEPIHA